MAWTAEDEARAKRQADQIVAARVSGGRALAFFGVLGTVATVAILVAVVLVRTALERDKAATAPALRVPTVQAADDRIRSTDLDGDALTVKADISNCWAADTGCSGAVVGNVAQAIQAHPQLARGAKLVIFQFRHEVQDRLGHKSFAPLYSAAFNAADLRAGDFKALSPDQALDLATSVLIWDRAAAAEVAQFCLTAEGARHFCAKAPD